MTVVCPCCGHEFAGNLYAGCTACGARAVGEPLSRPLRELPSYMPAFFACVTGALLLAILIVSTITAQLEHGSLFHTSFSALADAAETAAWRIKYAALPASIAALWIALRTQARVRRFPLRFAGTRLAHAGIAGSALALLLIAASIGVTVPERLRRRQLGITAASNAQLWTLNRALLKYRAQSGTFPIDLHDLQQLPDNDGSIAAALAAVDPNGNGYKPTSVQARLPKRVRSLRGAALRTISATNVNDLPDEGLTFTNYELTLPGADKILGTADDVTMRDSVIIEPSKPSRSSAATLSSNDASAP